MPGLGDEAIALSATDQPAGRRRIPFEALLVRYGDTVVYVSFSNANADKVKAFDLDLAREGDRAEPPPRLTGSTADRSRFPVPHGADQFSQELVRVLAGAPRGVVQEPSAGGLPGRLP